MKPAEWSKGWAMRVGERVPEFALRDQHGAEVSLADVRRERAVLLVFYPWAFTRVCTGELTGLQQQLADFDNDRVALLALSCDSMFTLRAFAEEQGITFPLLSDYWPHGAVAQEYGVFDSERGCALRGTFLVDRDGVLRWSVHHEIPDARDLDDYRAALAELPGGEGHRNARGQAVPR